MPSVVILGCKPAPVERTKAEVESDQALANRVRAALSLSASFKFPDVQVVAFRGTVQLSGFARSDGQKKAAEQIAGEVSGTSSVQNKISLRP